LKGFIVTVMLLGAMQVSAQLPEPEIEKYLARVEQGEADQVRAEMPSLLSKYPNHPGVLYLQGVVTADGAQAVRIYQSVVDNFPGSRWAADALYRVYQYYYALGLYRTAELKMAQLRRDYPNSKYVVTGTGVELTTLPEEKEESPQPDSTGVEKSLDQGVAPPMTQPDLRPAQVSGLETQFSLQVGAYGSQENAQKQKLFFESLGYPVGVQTKVKDSRSLYTVVVGNFRTYDEAKAQSLEIKKKYNIDSFVVAR
jgi:hypothetical protein